MKVYDVRDPNTQNDGIIIIGGFVGELIISFTCLLDYILASPHHQNFFFSVEMIEAFLVDLLGQDDSQWPDAICTLNLARDLKELNGGKELSAEQTAKLARDPKNMADFGLKFIFEVAKDLVLVPDVIDNVYRAICKIATRKPVAAQEIPEIPEDADDDKRDVIQEEIEKVKEANEALEKENAKYAKM
jgi:hypothetical protein